MSAYSPEDMATLIGERLTTEGRVVTARWLAHECDVDHDTAATRLGEYGASHGEVHIVYCVIVETGDSRRLLLVSDAQRAKLASKAKALTCRPYALGNQQSIDAIAVYNAHVADDFPDCSTSISCAAADECQTKMAEMLLKKQAAVPPPTAAPSVPKSKSSTTTNHVKVSKSTTSPAEKKAESKVVGAKEKKKATSSATVKSMFANAKPVTKKVVKEEEGESSEDDIPSTKRSSRRMILDDDEEEEESSPSKTPTKKTNGKRDANLSSKTANQSMLDVFASEGEDSPPPKKTSPKVETAVEKKKKGDKKKRVESAPTRVSPRKRSAVVAEEKTSPSENSSKNSASIVSNSPPVKRKTLQTSQETTTDKDGYRVSTTVKRTVVDDSPVVAKASKPKAPAAKPVGKQQGLLTNFFKKKP